MYRTPTSRRKGHKELTRPNLIPILDAVFIFIFFLLMSASFLKLYEIQSDVPIISDQEPPKDQKDPLALTLTINASSISVKTGVPSRTIRNFPKGGDGKYDLVGLRSFLINLKKRHLAEKTVVMEPVVDITYEEVVEIMDAIRMLKKTDPTFWRKDKDGIEQKVTELFNNIVFGNIRS